MWQIRMSRTYHNFADTVSCAIPSLGRDNDCKPRKSQDRDLKVPRIISFEKFLGQNKV